jgi:hypothetical protein
MAAADVMPSKMTALYYDKPRHFSVIQADLPVIDEHEVLLKGSSPPFSTTQSHFPCPSLPYSPFPIRAVTLSVSCNCKENMKSGQRLL